MKYSFKKHNKIFLTQLMTPYKLLQIFVGPYRVLHYDVAFLKLSRLY